MDRRSGSPALGGSFLWSLPEPSYADCDLQRLDLAPPQAHLRRHGGLGPRPRARGRGRSERARKCPAPAPTALRAVRARAAAA